MKVLKQFVQFLSIVYPEIKRKKKIENLFFNYIESMFLAQPLGLYDWSVRPYVRSITLERKELEG
jgi:hypothetical protein